MTNETRTAITERQPEIELGGGEVNEAIFAIRSQLGFIPSMERQTGNGRWKLKVHWPQAATGELPLSNSPAVQHEAQSSDTEQPLT